MLKFIILPALLVAIVVGIVAGMQYASGNRAEALKTAQGGLELVAKTIMVMAGVAAGTMMLILIAIIYFFPKG